ncbi:MAG: D-alanyl-D-alanine carboxypeptidase/D-alanyl-D-alanine-endopeptidase [Spirosomataceae bacterium]
MKLLLFIILQVSSPLQKLKNFIDSVQNDNDLKTGILAATIRSTSTGDYKLQVNSDKSVNSASVLKLVTTATALSVLKSDFRYQTYFEYDGQIVDSTLYGNIYIRGTGDPSFGSSRFGIDYSAIFEEVISKIKFAGIKKIDGYVLGDGSIFPENSIADSWVWGDIGNYYGAGVNGLNINENLYWVYFKPGNSVNDFAPIIRFSTDLPNLNVTNKVLTGEVGSGDNVIIYNTPLSNQILMQGTVPKGVPEFGVKGSLPDPAFYAAYILHKKLSENGISVKNQAISISQYRQILGYYSKPRTTISIYDSPSLAVLAKHCNFQSINLFADAFIKTLGYQYAKDANFDASVNAVKAYWNGKGIDLQGFMIKDGSGLSPSGFLTSKNLTDILYSMKSDSSFNDFYNSIPIVGQSGTVQNLGRRTKADGNVRAKSGSISNTRAFAGYFTASNGELMSFTFIINRYLDGADRKIRKILEQMMVMMVDI